MRDHLGEAGILFSRSTSTPNDLVFGCALFSVFHCAASLALFHSQSDGI